MRTRVNFALGEAFTRGEHRAILEFISRSNIGLSTRLATVTFVSHRLLFADSDVDSCRQGSVSTASTGRKKGGCA